MSLFRRGGDHRVHPIFYLTTLLLRLFVHVADGHIYIDRDTGFLFDLINLLRCY